MKIQRRSLVWRLLEDYQIKKKIDSVCVLSSLKFTTNKKFILVEQSADCLGDQQSILHTQLIFN